MLKRFRAPFLTLLISAIFVCIWFRNGNILGTAESALPFHDLSRQYEIIGGAWANSELGNSTSIYVASAPFYRFFGVIQDFGVSGVTIEAFVFWFTMSTAGMSVYHLIKLLFPKIDQRAVLLSSFLYLFNPFTIVNVWQRFLYNYIFFIALLPLSVYLFIKGVKKRNYDFALLTSLSTLLFSFALTSLVFNALLWFVFGYIFLVFFLSLKRRKSFLIKYFLLTAVAFIFLNFWWIIQFFSFFQSSIYSTSVGQFFTTGGNLRSLDALSESLGHISNIVRMIHGTFFEDTVGWKQLFNSPLTDAFMFLIPGIVFWTIYKYRKNKKIFVLAVLYLVLIFLAKGSSGPFAGIYRGIFVNLSALQIFRNPFEKFSFVLVLVTMILFSFGLDKIDKKLIKPIKYFLYFLLSVTVVLFVYPFASGLVFTYEDYENPGNFVSYETQVPKYYEEANDWLVNQGDNFRLLFLPIGEEGITYTWNKPYSGVELSNSLMDIPSISHSTTIPYYYDISRLIENALQKYPSLNGEILNRLNIRFVVVRNDINWRFRDMRSPANVSKFLGKTDLVQRVKFGNLEVWENTKWTDRTVYLTNDLYQVHPDVLVDDYIIPSSSTSIAVFPQGVDMKEYSKIIHPFEVYFVGKLRSTGLSDEQDIFPHVNYLPGHPFYRLILLKENIEKKLLRGDDEIAQKIILLLGKRIKEIEKLLETGNNPDLVLKVLYLYEDQLNQLESIVDRLNIPALKKDKRGWRQEEVFLVFLQHKNALNQLKARAQSNQIRESLERMISKIDTILKEMKTIPFYGYVTRDDFPLENRLTHQMIVPLDGQYELLIASLDWEDYYNLDVSRELMLQIDDEIMSFVPEGEVHGYVSYGKLTLDKGVHGISINTPERKNLVEFGENDQITLRVDHGKVEKRYKISNFKQGSSYEIAFDYWIRMGAGLTLSLVQNNDRIILGEVIPKFLKDLEPDEYYFDKKSFSETIKTFPTSDSAEIVFSVEPWNDCENFYPTSKKERCEIEEIRKKYERPTEVVIENVSVKKVLNSQAVLLLRKPVKITTIPVIKYKKISNAKYEIAISKAQEPFYLVLTQLFNSGWKVRYGDDQTFDNSNHYLIDGYANGWLVEREGDFNMILYFDPEDRLVIGKYISKLSSIGILLFLGGSVFFKKRRYDN